MKKILSVIALCALPGLTSGGDVDADGIVSSDRVPEVALTNGIAVCADAGINSIAASEIEWWLHSSAGAGLDQRITAALEVSVKSSRSTSHSGTTTTCESSGAGIAFVRPDGSVNGSAPLMVRFTVTASPDGSPHVAVDDASLLSAAQVLVKLQQAELRAEKLTP